MANRQHVKRVAIIGSGSAGIAALWALNKTYHDVYMFEAADRLGGHINTVQWKSGKYSTAVDTGFVVLNSTTYPNFVKFLDKIGVTTEPTRMTIGVSRDYGLFEWAGPSWNAIFSRKRNILSTRMWRMMFDIVRFNSFSLDLLAADSEEPRLDGSGMVNHVSGAETIGEYLIREGYSDAFRDDYLIPMTAALWRASPDKSALEFPAAELIRSLWSHNLLHTITARPQWLTLKEGATSYVEAVMKGFPPNHLFLKTPVRRVSNNANGQVVVHLENGTDQTFDHVVLAVHGDEALSLLGQSATQEERSILSCFQTSQNEAVLHSDLTLMPRNRNVWSGLNFLSVSTTHRGKAAIEQASLTYNMNILQHIPRQPFGDIFVTVNPLHRPRPGKVQGRYFYSDPLYTASAVRAQRLLPRIQNKRGISYAGAWTKYGFHEDGISSGLYVAEQYLGAKVPFEIEDWTVRRGVKPRLGLIDHLMRLIILLIQVFVVQVLERLAASMRYKNKVIMNGKFGKNQKRA